MNSKAISCTCILLFALVLTGPARAQETIGLYFDQGATATTFDTTVPNEIVNGWLILTGLDQPGDVTAFKARIDVTTAEGHPAASVFWSLAASGQNFHVPPRFDVWYQTPLPWTGDVVLATMLAIVPDSDGETEFHISAHPQAPFEDPLGWPVHLPAIQQSPDNEYTRLVQSSGNNYKAVATINDDGADSPYPRVTRHFTGGGGDAIPGESITGRFRYFTNDAERDLEAQLVPIGTTEIRAVGDMYSGHPVLNSYTNEPVWIQLPEVPASASFEWRATSDEPGTLDFGYRLVAGGEILQETVITRTFHSTPCRYVGYRRDPVPLGDPVAPLLRPFGPEEGWWEIGAAQVSAERIDMDFAVINQSQSTPLEIYPSLTGSPDFSLEGSFPYPITLEEYYDLHEVRIAFRPSTPGEHLATLDFGPDTCEPIQIRAWGSGVADVPDHAAVEPGLVSIHPNPFNPRTTVAFVLDEPGRVELAVYDLQGRLVKRLAGKGYPAGRSEVVWTGDDASGGRVASGTYLVHLKGPTFEESRRISLIK